MSAIYEAGKATGNVISSTGQAFQSATSGIPWWGKLALVGSGIGIAGYIAYIGVSGLVGNSCNNPGSPCYNALSTYVETYNTCANEYAKYLSQFLKEDSANGTGFTAAQLNELNNLQNCMNNAS
ncbi:MAG: hypothetical protein OWS74_09470, partial [Firmicutes bacterium]|nr:hypothetical protein [Bacillota bacterium]